MASSSAATPPRAPPPSSYQAFLARLNHPDSSSLLRSLKLFIRNALAASTLTLDELAESTRNFFYETEAAIAAHPQWAGCDPAELERAADGVEKYVMTRLHDRVFAAVPSEAAEDEQLTTWLQRLRFLRVDHLAISPEFRTLQPWTAAQQELGRICTYKTPRDKLVCILNCCKRINSALSQASNGGHGADEFFPVLLYVTVQAAPAGLHASLQYISRFRHPSKLVSEAAYYLTHQQSAISFLSNVQPEQLNIESAEFEAGLAETHAAIEKQKAEAAEAKAVAEAEAAAAAEAKAEAEAAAAEAAEPEAAEAAVENGSSATTPTAERQRLPSQNGGSNGTTTTTSSSSYAAAAASARGTASAFFATLLENSPSGPSKLFDSLTTADSSSTSTPPAAHKQTLSRTPASPPTPATPNVGMHPQRSRSNNHASPSQQLQSSEGGGGSGGGLFGPYEDEEEGEEERQPPRSPPEHVLRGASGARRGVGGGRFGARNHGIAVGVGLSVHRQPVDVGDDGGSGGSSSSAGEVAVRVELKLETWAEVRRRQMARELGEEPTLRFLETRSVLDLTVGDVAGLLEEYKWLSSALRARNDWSIAPL